MASCLTNFFCLHILRGFSPRLPSLFVSSGIPSNDGNKSPAASRPDSSKNASGSSACKVDKRIQDPIAVGLLSEAVQKMPQSAEYRYHLGMALSGAGQKDKAKEELSKALQLAPPLKGDDAKQAQDTLAKL